MSQEINNSQVRKEAIKEMLKMLHDGKSADEVKQYFEEVFENVSATEISQAEQALIAEGLPVTEIQKLCDIHAAVFKGSIEEIHAVPESEIAGHPVWVMKKENQEITNLVNNRLLPTLHSASKDFANNKSNLLKAIMDLEKIKTHYERKENLLFPYLEKHGITGPPQVMWGVDDEIRVAIKESISAVISAKEYSQELSKKIADTATKVSEMVFKEDNILIPMLLETLSRVEWVEINNDLAEIGYAYIKEAPIWKPATQNQDEKPQQSPSLSQGKIQLPTGFMTIRELESILNVLPIDISFVDKDGIVRYFSENSERIFPRTKTVIGRKVINCHPPASMHVVEQILEDFASGKKSQEEFWIKMRGNYIYIRYFAVRGDNNEFLGTLEVTQNITPIQAITGEKRLLSE